jgi:Na+/H+ antiporter NhaD/arsenite permease-like protein
MPFSLVLFAAEGAALDLPFWTAIPFVLLLLSIALLPLFAEYWWHHNSNRALVSALFAVPVVAYLLYYRQATGADTLTPLIHELEGYLAFIILLGSLYVISGGILLSGDLRGTPTTNTLILALGAVIANAVGTTGASMLLIRPILRINAQRQNKYHLPIFFIFIVSNLGGLLTPLGDPPLFLGYLKGIPFSWTFILVYEWATTLGIVLAIFFIWDSIAYVSEPKQSTHPTQPQTQEPLRLQGIANLPLLAGVIVGVLVQGMVPGNPLVHWGGVAIMFVMGLLSLAVTSKSLREANGFTWGPIAEVAILFLGIFICMVPTLEILKAHGREFGITQPWQYFWLTGSLSAFLDNAPTYLTFATLAADGQEIKSLVTNAPLVLEAISCGAVFMGAMSYIGNGPNFMVKAIAEEAGYPMPSFFGYMAYSVCILVPVFVVITLVFFSPWG